MRNRKNDKEDESRIQASEMKFLCSIIQKIKRDKFKNDEIRDILSLEKLQDTMESNRVK